jgi:ubiquinone/menaquinone biosynthesis C-methylase UbiE
MKPIRPRREQACQGLAGEVIEIGFGSGLNVPFYPTAVARVTAVEPADAGWKLAQRRISESPVPVVRSGLDGQSLPFDDASFDSALCTFTLCTIPDAAAAMAEVRRVLKPGGSFHYLEHGLAPDAKVQRWQHRMEPVQRRLFGGCHLTRNPAEIVESAGFAVTVLDAFYQPGGPKAVGAFSIGAAVAQ